VKLEGKVAVITGGGSGLGRETAMLFAEEGARVVILERVPERARQAAELISARGGTVESISGDVGIEADVERAVDLAVDRFGRLDVMFANAGHQTLTWGVTPIDAVTDAEWQDVLSTNLTGVIWSVKHAARAMKQGGRGGSIIMTGSAAAVRAFPTCVLYSATKGGVNGLTFALARDLGPYGIKVNTINPLQGMSPNFMLPRDAPVVGKSYEEAAGEEWNPVTGAAVLQLGRPPTLRDNARSVLFLACDDSGHMTGQLIAPNDGGILNNIAMQFDESWVDSLLTGVDH
jgi:NAD(P)-dependent dehydrogenase (short-subunit alcohol dehydrogenase family)